MPLSGFLIWIVEKTKGERCTGAALGHASLRGTSYLVAEESSERTLRFGGPLLHFDVSVLHQAGSFQLDCILEHLSVGVLKLSGPDHAHEADRNNH